MSNLPPPDIAGYYQAPSYQPLPGSSQNPLSQGTPLARVAPTVTLVKKQVQITDGQFIIDVPVSKHVLNGAKYTQGEEFTHLRYTAVTTDPNDYNSVYSLRPKLYKRNTKIAVVMTMYNEDDILFAKTFTAVMKNIAYLCSGKVGGWHRESWQEIYVVIVSDGRSKINPLTENVLSLMGLYNKNLCKASVNGKPVTGHFFEFTTQLAVQKNLMIRKANDVAHDRLSLVPVQTLFLLKEKNAKKINSHRWYFNAVCQGIDPEVCILLDVGTKPTKESFYHLYRAFDRNPNVAGACGEIAAELGKFWYKAINPIVAVQNFEYKMSNILDKPLESVFGYISVLPGAFSAYRYKALLGRPLECYFKGETPHGRDVKEANMAEDRILCFELVMKKEHQYVLKYVKSAKAETDVPSEFTDLIKQRRRWLNGSFFASLHAVLNFGRIYSSGHTVTRKFILTLEMIYQAVLLLFSWFNPANLFLSFFFLFQIASDAADAACNLGTVSRPGIDPFYPYGSTVSGLIRAIYVASLMSMIIFSLGNRPEANRGSYLFFAIVFSIIFGFMLFMGVWTIKISIENYIATNPNGIASFVAYTRSNPTFRDLVISIIATYGVYLVSSILHLDPWHCFTCMLQYLFMIPAFINIIMVYAFCNIHDVSWGTKGIVSDKPAGGDVKVSVNANGIAVATVDLPSEDQSADRLWEHMHQEIMEEALNLSKRNNKEVTNKNDDDAFRQYRTITVIIWFITNYSLVYIFTNPAFIRSIQNSRDVSQVNPYLTFLFWSVAVISVIRFFCSMLYLVGWYSDALSDAGKRNMLKPVVDGARVYSA